jgi:hypothetical protein
MGGAAKKTFLIILTCVPLQADYMLGTEYRLEIFIRNFLQAEK